jgi:hypothetical protein
LCLAVGAFGQGTIVWDEGVNGPLSHFSSSPTALGAFQLGTNSVIGKVEIEPSGGIWFAYEDFFTLSVPPSLSLNAVFFHVDKPDVQTWIGDGSFGNPLGYATSSASGELLAQWGMSPIGAGGYGMYVANHDAQAFPSIATYRLDFLVQSVPEPGTFALALIGAIGLAVWRRKGRGPRLGTGHRKNTELNISKRR